MEYTIKKVEQTAAIGPENEPAVQLVRLTVSNEQGDIVLIAQEGDVVEVDTDISGRITLRLPLPAFQVVDNNPNPVG